MDSTVSGNIWRAGVDVGFSTVKAFARRAIGGPTAETVFPSVVGTPAPAGTFSMAGDGDLIVSVDGGPLVPTGNAAFVYSTHTSGSRNPGWVLGEDWLTLLMAALGQMITVPDAVVDLVIGLPVDDWASYAEKLEDQLAGHRHTVAFHKQEPHSFLLRSVLVVTQPYGTLAGAALDQYGRLLPNIYAQGFIGVADVGGGTVNLLVADHLQEVSRFTTSGDLGLLPALDQVRAAITAGCPGLRPSTPEVAEWMAAGRFRYHGQPMLLDNFDTPVIGLLSTLESWILSHWTEPGRLDEVLLTGGGALALGRYLQPRLQKHFPVRIADDARTANARGYLALAAHVFGGA